MIASLLVPGGLPVEHNALAAGLAAAGFKVVNHALPEAKLAVIWGGSPPPRQPECPVLVAENAYWNGPEGPYIALAAGGHNGSGRTPEANHARFGRLGIELAPWRQSGGHILVCPSRGIGQNPQPPSWTARVVEVIGRHTDREVRVREHPGNWKTLPEHPDTELRRCLVDAWACVIWASAAGIRALIQGIPVVRCGPAWVCEAAAGDRLETIDAPVLGDRPRAFAKMASSQWSLAEVESGEAIRALLPLAGVA